jgi:hypothetical protein
MMGLSATGGHALRNRLRLEGLLSPVSGTALHIESPRQALHRGGASEMRILKQEAREADPFADPRLTGGRL